ncbi:MAG: hypothetical protein QOJ64_4280 [Acidobacteriota bacterium]|nr:hypothetical protein [Acidobacteriota bacterium]
MISTMLNVVELGAILEVRNKTAVTLPSFTLTNIRWLVIFRRAVMTESKYRL